MTIALVLACALVVAEPSTQSGDTEKIARATLDLLLQEDYAAVDAQKSARSKTKVATQFIANN